MSTAEQRALWAAIRANPDDDLPRLVYADWCDENGDPARAEFIRVQCELARLPADQHVDGTLRSVLVAREAELLTAHRNIWTREIRRVLRVDSDSRQRDWWSTHVAFHRGFIKSLSLDFSRALLLVRSTVEPEPITTLAIYNPALGFWDTSAVRNIVKWQFGRVLTGFQVRGATDSDVKAFAGGRLTKLRYLAFTGGKVGDAGVATLARSPLLATVKQLQLKGNMIGDTGAAALADSPHLSPDVLVVLHYNRLTEIGVARLRERFGDRVSANVRTW